MNTEGLITALEQIRGIVDATLADAKLRGRRRAKTPKEPTGQPSTLPDHILRLRSDGFFKRPQAVQDVQTKLTTAYPCDLNRVAVALLRLQKRQELRKTSKLVDGQKLVAYAW